MQRINSTQYQVRINLCNINQKKNILKGLKIKAGFGQDLGCGIGNLRISLIQYYSEIQTGVTRMVSMNSAQKFRPKYHNVKILKDFTMLYSGIRYSNFQDFIMLYSGIRYSNFQDFALLQRDSNGLMYKVSIKCEFITDKKYFQEQKNLRPHGRMVKLKRKKYRLT